MSEPLPTERWTHPLAQPLEIDRNGPFVELADGSLVTVDDQGFRVCKDDGKTWSEAIPDCKGINPKEPSSYYLLRSRNNTLILVYLNFSDYRFEWGEQRKESKEGCKLEVLAIRSIDGGRVELTTSGFLRVTMQTFSV